MKLVRGLMVFGCATVGLLACKTQTTQSSSVTRTTGVVQTTAPVGYVAATGNITGARCDRQITCNQVGASRRFESRKVCTDEEGTRTQSELGAGECPNGVDSAKLQSCLRKISTMDCSKLIASLQSIDECKAAALCLPLRQ
jgi:hypothetical protein